MIVPVYCLDTSSVLEAWRRHYPPDVFVGFWRDLQCLLDEGSAISPDEVRQELTQKDDEIALWAEQQRNCFVPFDEELQGHLVSILAEHELLMKSTKQKNAADPFVLALALHRNLIVVTEEVEGGENKPRIPDVCDSLKLEHISILGLMKKEGWTY